MFNKTGLLTSITDSPNGVHHNNGHAAYRFGPELLKLSVAMTLQAALAEWSPVGVHTADDGEEEQCLCGKYPIKEVWLIRNNRNGKQAIVGSVCVQRFLGLPAQAICTGLQRIETDLARSMGTAALQHFHDKGVVNNYEYRFYRETLNLSARWLTRRQLALRQQINAKVLSRAGRAV
jgi:hypothetical protein